MRPTTGEAAACRSSYACVLTSPCARPAFCNAGPAYLVAMFGPESLLGTLGTWGRRQPQHPAATIIKTACDFSECLTYNMRFLEKLPGATGDWRDSSRLRDFAALTESPSSWYPDQLFGEQPRIRFPDKEVHVALKPITVAQLHMLYCRLVGPACDGARSYGELWALVVSIFAGGMGVGAGAGGLGTEVRAAAAAAARKRCGVGSDLPVRDHTALLTVFTTRPETLLGRMQPGELRLAHNAAHRAAVELPSVGVGPITLRPGSWFLCRRVAEEEGASLWFGQVARILKHCGPDGKTRAILEAKWHECTVIDTLYRLPVIPAAPTRTSAAPCGFARTWCPLAAGRSACLARGTGCTWWRVHGRACSYHSMCGAMVPQSSVALVCCDAAGRWGCM